MVGGGTRYTFVDNFDNYTLSYYGSFSASFKLLEAGIDYTYGKTKGDGRVEKKLAANLKKKF
jgi:flagellum-specific peptidoglycan hydrolase FlgJ